MTAFAGSRHRTAAPPVATASASTSVRIHYYGYPPNGDGNFVLVDQYGWHRLYRMYLWFDYVPAPGGSVCPKAGLNTLIGHAQFQTD